MSFKEVSGKIKENKNIIIELEKDITYRKNIIENLLIEQRKICPHLSFSEVYMQRVSPSREDAATSCLTCGYVKYIEGKYKTKY